ncbi:hypothetical protein O181_055501 [Austropuccinia psidii MF-1]|uniref:Uncharacterized protein n=1 Tax=Austropuccinia psidii MF-1 TaxID=1389203 RepID=A0A9Q3HS40_9BASI|nr:hypothetical protein [Austropuccinia psidii MF-1]
MLFQHSPPARQTRSQDRAQAVLTPTPRAPVDETPAVSQLRAHLDRRQILGREAPSRKEVRGPRRSSYFSGVVGSFQDSQGPLSKVPVKMFEPSSLAIMQQMTWIVANLQGASSFEESRTPDIKIHL